MWSNDFQQQCQDRPMGERQSVQQMMLGKLDIPMCEDEVESLLYTVYKN